MTKKKKVHRILIYIFNIFININYKLKVDNLHWLLDEWLNNCNFMQDRTSYATSINTVLIDTILIVGINITNLIRYEIIMNQSIPLKFICDLKTI